MFSSGKVLLVLISLHCQYSWGYHNGAPLEACGDLIPKHGAPSQPFSEDHQLVVDKVKGRWSFSLGERINFTLSLVDENRPQFKGFLIQVCTMICRILESLKIRMNFRYEMKITRLLANLKALILKCKSLIAMMDIEMPSLTCIIARKVIFMPLGLPLKKPKSCKMESNSSTLLWKKSLGFGPMSNHLYWN